jgi:hypothetical protein
MYVSPASLCLVGGNKPGHGKVRTFSRDGRSIEANRGGKQSVAIRLQIGGVTARHTIIWTCDLGCD